MTPASSLSHSDDIDQLPLARLYAEEESFVSPLREYLETHGCRVIVNDNSLIPETYFLVAGSPVFVKHIFATKATSALRVIGIVVTTDVSEGKNLADDSRKIVVIDPRYLSNTDVREIFAFFFSGTETLLNIIRNIHEPITHIDPASNDAKSVPSGVPSITEIHQSLPPIVPRVKSVEEVLTQNDSERINHIMTDVFGDPHVRKKKHRYLKIQKHMLRTIGNITMYTFFLFGVVLFPLSVYLAGLSASTFFLLRAANFISKTDMVRASSSLNRGEYWLSQTEFIFSLIKTPTYIFGVGEPIRNQERVLSLLSDLMRGITESMDVVTQGKQFIEASIPSSVREDEKLPASSLESLRISVVAAHNSLGLAEAELSALMRDQPFPFSFRMLQPTFSHAEYKLQSIRKILSYAEELLTVYPKIAGFKTTQSFLVLLQNSNELRPMGGFIGSLGLATFDNGILSDFSIEDVYAIDGQLKGHVDPPRPIAELLGNEHWYLRDSNWDPDFSISGQRAEWFYEKETGKHVDGVLAINIPIIERMLTAIGPIQLPDYNDRITKENFFGKSLYYTQNNFFPGSTQKRDFLGSLARAAMTKIMTDKDIDSLALIKAVMDGIEQRDMLLHIQDPEVQSMIEHFGWGGRVYDSSTCTGVDVNRCIGGEILFSEANLSVSKVNYYVTHEASREITITPQQEINERVLYTIGNTANTAANPNEKGVGGTYQTYVRLLLPKDSIVNTVLLDGVPIPTRSTAQKNMPELPYIENADGTAQARGIGIALRVAPGEKKQIQITYARSQHLQIGKGGGYLDLLWYKHPGISSMPLHTIIRYPPNWKMNDESLNKDESISTFIAKSGEFEYNTRIERDIKYRIKFIQ